MRVIWISVGLFAAFLAGLMVAYEPEPGESGKLAAVSKLDNPFVEDSVASDFAPNKKVDLAVLPSQPVSDVPSTSGQVESSITQSPENKVQSPESGVSAIEATKRNRQPVAVADNEAQKPSEQIPSQQLRPEQINAEEKEVAQAVGENTGNKQKLGLAMLVLEKEQKKNKLAVIVHESNSQQLTEKEIKALYLDRLTRWQDGSRVMLYNLPLGDKFRDKFSTSVLKMTALEADMQEAKRRELHIKANEVEVKAKNVVVSYVEQHPNAVAYVPLNLIRDKSTVKVVFTIP